MNTQTKQLLAASAALERESAAFGCWRPAFHLAPPTGYLNDPNGLCQIDGVYHIFFQYSPFDTVPGLTYWGHFTTTDFSRYRYYEPALCSDEPFDCGGVFSGSAVSEPDGIHLYYTGNVCHSGDYDYITTGREHNTILARSDDGIHYDRKQVLLQNADYPQDLTCHVRDPKVWKRADGSYGMVLGARTRGGKGQILVYESADGIHFTLANRLHTEPLGYMWECPDYFTLGDVHLLCFSPQGVAPRGWEFRNIYQSGYVRLSASPETGKIVSEFQELDRGFDFYAPQSFLDELGRRILIGWMGLPDLKEYSNPTADQRWMHMLTIPRELKWIDGSLHQQPLQEYYDMCYGETPILPYEEAVTENTFCAKLEFIPDAAHAEILIHEDCRLAYDGACLSLQFGSSGCGRKERRAPAAQLRQLTIFCDNSCLEVFINDGEDVMTSRFYPSGRQNRILVKGNLTRGTIWKIKPFFICT